MMLSTIHETVEHVHQGLHQQIIAIGGHYVLVKEARLPFQGGEILYLVGHAAFDTTCCGPGGCAYALVPGVIRSWQSSRTEKGLAVSQVEPVHEPDRQNEIRNLIERLETVQQVVFS